MTKVRVHRLAALLGRTNLDHWLGGLGTRSRRMFGTLLELGDSGDGLQILDVALAVHNHFAQVFPHKAHRRDLLPNLVEFDHKLRQRLAFLRALCLGFGIGGGWLKLELARL